MMPNRMKILKWTKKIPDQDGFYWYRGENSFGQPMVVEVELLELDGTRFWVAKAHEVEFDPYNGGYFDGERNAPPDPDAEWAGPLSEPKR